MKISPLDHQIARQLYYAKTADKIVTILSRQTNYIRRKWRYVVQAYLSDYGESFYRKIASFNYKDYIRIIRFLKIKDIYKYFEKVYLKGKVDF